MAVQINEPQFPIFLIGKDDYMLAIKSFDDLNSKVESNDVEYSEYAGWDIVGRPVTLILVSNHIEAKLLSEERQIEKLFVAIVRFTALIRPHPRFEPPSNLTDPLQLWALSEKHIRDHRPFWSLTRIYEQCTSWLRRRG